MRITDALVPLLLAAPVAYAVTATEAPAGFGGDTNGFSPQTQFELDLETFEEREGQAQKILSELERNASRGLKFSSQVAGPPPVRL